MVCSHNDRKVNKAGAILPNLNRKNVVLLSFARKCIGRVGETSYLCSRPRRTYWKESLRKLPLTCAIRELKKKNEDPLRDH